MGYGAVRIVGSLLIAWVALAGLSQAADEAAKLAEKEPATEWKALFNGKNLDGWESTRFGGEGDVEVKDGAIILNRGSELTGVTYTGKPPKTNYELLVEAQRIDGIDFFAATTFPIAGNYASLIPGGWAGGVTGISSINGQDASENETTKYRPFDDKKWYAFRIRVTDERLLVWIDDKLQIDLELKDKKMTTRGEVTLSQPIGLASYSTAGAIRTVKIRDLSADEVKETNAAK
jgi:hypothetical protein